MFFSPLLVSRKVRTLHFIDRFHLRPAKENSKENLLPDLLNRINYSKLMVCLVYVHTVDNEANHSKTHTIDINITKVIKYRTDQFHLLLAQTLWCWDFFLFLFTVDIVLVLIFPFTFFFYTYFYMTFFIDQAQLLKILWKVDENTDKLKY